MTKKLAIISICFALTVTIVIQSAQAIGFTSIINIVKTATGFLKTANQYGNTLDGYVPHNFSFGGHITTSERACSLKAWLWFPTPFGIVPCPNCFYWPFAPFGGSAIEVGPPISSHGKVIVFPWISEIYRNKQEDRVGPWALGLGFTPFPLEKINDALDLITIPYGVGWIDHIHIACSESGEKDQSGNAIYKVILKLGTSF